MATSRTPEAREVIARIRRRIDPVDRQLMGHPYPAAIESGAIPKEKLAVFVCEQYAIIESDLRSVAHLVSRFGGTPAREFFINVFLEEKAAMDALPALSGPFGLTKQKLEEYEQPYLYDFS